MAKGQKEEAEKEIHRYLAHNDPYWTRIDRRTSLNRPAPKMHLSAVASVKIMHGVRACRVHARPFRQYAECSQPAPPSNDVTTISCISANENVGSQYMWHYPLPNFIVSVASDRKLTTTCR